MTEGEKTCTNSWNNLGLFPEGFWNHSSQTVTNRQLSKDGVGVEHVDFKDTTLSPGKLASLRGSQQFFSCSCEHMPEAIVLMRAGTGRIYLTTSTPSLATSRSSLELKKITVLHCFNPKGEPLARLQDLRDLLNVEVFLQYMNIKVCFIINGALLKMYSKLKGIYTQVFEFPVALRFISLLKTTFSCHVVEKALCQ